jgi:hypothetical protein
MERRRSRRKNVNIEAKIISEGTGYSANIENISKHGISLETNSKDILDTSTRFNPGTEFKVKFQTPSGEEINLYCKVIWSYKAAPHGLKSKIGMEVIFPPPSYIDFYETSQQS